MAVWLLLSGHYSPLLIGLGAVSCGLSLWLSRRLGADPDWPVLARMVPGLAGYLPWLVLAVVKSNLDLCRRIWHPALPIQPQVLRVQSSQETGLGITAFANSITLTPGTLSLEVLPGEIEVHALSDVSARDLASGEMNRRVRALEVPR